MVQEKVKIRKNVIDIDLDTIHQIKEIFLNPDVKKVYPKLKWNKFNYEKVEELLIEEHNFSNL